MNINESLEQTLATLASLPEDPNKIVQIAGITPEAFKRFMKDMGLTEDAEAISLLEAAIEYDTQERHQLVTVKSSNKKQQTKPLILCIDDEAAIRHILKSCLLEIGYEPILATNGEEALRFFNEHDPELVILDIKIPDMDGFEVCRSIREYSSVPIIILTSLGQDGDVLQGLQSGADDYITKPININVLLARIQSVMRRSNRWDTYNKPQYSYEGLVIDFKENKVKMGEREVNLTATEFRLLSFLVSNTGRAITSDQILEAVWGKEYVGENHILRVNIGRLRQKLEDNPHNPQYIVTKNGIGYMFCKQD